METINKANREQYFSLLKSSVDNCDLCPRMCDRKKVLSQYNGNINSKVVFVAEAPGRLGAECTGIPLYGDKTGDNFDMLLGNIGWNRSDVFLTNAILCNPQDENGNNATPTKEEIANCSYYLSMTLELVNPELVITLGVKALEAIKLISPHKYVLKDCVAKCLDWNGIKLMPLYHMGPRALIHRPIAKQRADFIGLAHLIDPMNGFKKRVSIKKPKTQAYEKCLVDMVYEIVAQLKRVSFFKLTKLLYLVDLSHLKEFGASLSGSIYLRMQEGPWIPYLKNLSKDYNKDLFCMEYQNGKPFIRIVQGDYHTEFDANTINFIDRIINQYRDYTDADIKTAVYLTAPMKYILRQEKEGRNMTKTPVIYKNTTIIEADVTR